MTAAAPEVEIRRRRLTLPAGWRASTLAAAVVLAVIVIAGLAAPLLVGIFGVKGPSVRDPGALNLFGNPTGPSGAHPLGVDSQGRDVLSRILYGLRSLVLVSLAGGALGLVAGQLLARAATAHRWAGVGVQLLRSALASFPALLLGLALGLALGQGLWRLIVVIALTQLVRVPSCRALPLAAVRVLAGAAALDFALTFLGDGPGGATPQLGWMTARAGEAILAGVPAWWALLFPGLVVLVMLAAAQILTGPGEGGGPAPRVAGSAGRRLNYVADQLLAAAGRIVAVVLIGAVVFSRLGGSGGGGLGRVGSSLAASVSLLAGGAVVWLAATAAQLWFSTRSDGSRWRLPAAVKQRVPARLTGPGASQLWARVPGSRVSGAGARVGTALLAAVAVVPAGWLGLLALYLFSESVGKLAILPGAGSYVGLTADPGRWARSLVMPWLILGLIPAAAIAPSLAAVIRTEAASGQQRVARAAGVPEPRRRRQLRRAAAAPSLALARPWLAPFLSLAVLMEASFSLPGAGLLAVRGFGRAQAATVSDVAALAAVVVVLAWLVLDVGRVLIDPRAART